MALPVISEPAAIVKARVPLLFHPPPPLLPFPFPFPFPLSRSLPPTPERPFRGSARPGKARPSPFIRPAKPKHQASS